MNGLTNATSQDVAWCPKHQTAKWCCWFDGHCLTRLGSQKTWVFISLHRLQIRHSKILLILARPLPIGYFTFYYFSFFLIFNRMDAWSLMRGDAFIHFVCGSRRVNIRLGVLLLILKSPQVAHGCVILVVWGEKCECLQKMLSRDEVAEYLSGILRCSWHSQRWRQLKVVPVCGVLNLSNSYSTGNPWSMRIDSRGP